MGGTLYACAYGEIEDEAIYAKVCAFVRAAGAVAKLKGQTLWSYWWSSDEEVYGQK